MIKFVPMKKTLIKVSTYAESKGLTNAAIYAQIKRGELPYKKIDGVIFVVIK